MIDLTHRQRDVSRGDRPACCSSPSVALAVFGVYAWLSPPVSGMGDGSELTLVLATNGVAHPTGYPLYTLAGHLFCSLLHALGAGWPLAANLWSAAGGAVAIGFLHAAAMRLARETPGLSGTARFLAAFLPAILFAFQPIVLGEATSAEVNSWSLAWTCATAWTFLRLSDSIAGVARPSPPRFRRAAVLWGVLCGAGLVHHLTSMLVAAWLSAGLAVALGRRRLLAALLPAVAGASLPVVAGWGIIAWRAWHPARVQWPALAPDAASVLAHVSGEQYRHFLGYFRPATDQQELLARAGYPFLLPGLAFLLLGILRAEGHGRRVARAALFAAALTATVFSFRYGVPDPAPYFLPPMALGVAAAAPLLARLGRPRGGTVALGLAAAAALVLVLPWIRDQHRVRREFVRYESLIRSMWSAVPADSAIVFWPDDRFIRLHEYQLLRGEKPDLWIGTPDMLVEDRTRREFRTRFGIDPVEGFRIPSLRPGSPVEERTIRRALDRLMRSVNDRTRVPVILFDPSVPVVRQLRKPGEPARP